MNRICSIVLLSCVLALGQPIKIACIGNSITQHTTAAKAYPAVLGNLLGSGYQVENDGVSGCTLLKKGDMPYWTRGKLANVFAFKPDIITIKLGTNDSKALNWDAHKGEYAGDLKALVDTLSTMQKKPQIWLCLPVPGWPIGGEDKYGIRGTVIKNEIIPLIQKVADENKLKIIDLHTPMLAHKSFFLKDGVHPDDEGEDSIAHLIYRALKSPPSGIGMPAWNSSNPFVPDEKAAAGLELDLLGRGTRTEASQRQTTRTRAAGVRFLEPVEQTRRKKAE
jgi:lysophospholipase L1-like esterase